MADPRAVRFLETWKGQARLKRERLQKMLAQEPADLRAVWLREDWLSRTHQNLEARKLWLQTRLENVTAVLKIIEGAVERRKENSSTSSHAPGRRGTRIKK
jgi:hypothetical protein